MHAYRIPITMLAAHRSPNAPLQQTALGNVSPSWAEHRTTNEFNVTITVRRLNGTTFECIDGHMRLRAGLNVLGKVSVRDIETGEIFEVHEVNGQILVLNEGSKDRADTIAAQTIARARQS